MFGVLPRPLTGFGVLDAAAGKVLFAAPHFDDRRRNPCSSCFQTFKGPDCSTTGGTKEMVNPLSALLACSSLWF